MRIRIRLQQPKRADPDTAYKMYNKLLYIIKCWIETDKKDCLEAGLWICIDFMRIWIQQFLNADPNPDPGPGPA